MKDDKATFADWGDNWHGPRWHWYFAGAVSADSYTRRSSAIRGFKRFLARVRHISGKGRA